MRKSNLDSDLDAMIATIARAPRASSPEVHGAKTNEVAHVKQLENLFVLGRHLFFAYVLYFGYALYKQLVIQVSDMGVWHVSLADIY